MKRPDPTESALDALREATDMRPFLRHKSHLVVARAAARAMASQPPCTQELIEAFRRLTDDPVKRDPGCTAKIAIAKALAQAEEPAAEVYFAGVRHIQMEPVWGGQEDTARDLRGICAIGLVRMGHPEALLEAVRLLSDPASEARTGAIRALSESGRPEAELVLRFKAMQSDRNSEVTGECFAGLLRLGPRERSVPYVADFLITRDTEVAEAAAIALGESRLREAWPILRDAYSRPSLLSIQSALLLGIAMLRTDEGVDFLLERITLDRERAGAVAIEALALYRNDPSIRERLEKAVAVRNSPILEKALRTYWETG
jgi:HEAT repeat protein